MSDNIDCSEQLPYSIGDMVVCKDGEVYLYIRKGRDPGSVTGGVYHYFQPIAKPLWSPWRGVNLAKILWKFPRPAKPHEVKRVTVDDSLPPCNPASDLKRSDWTHIEKGGRYTVIDVTLPAGALRKMLPEGEMIVWYESTSAPGWKGKFNRLYSEWHDTMRRYPQAGDGAGGES